MQVPDGETDFLVLFVNFTPPRVTDIVDCGYIERRPHQGFNAVI